MLLVLYWWFHKSTIIWHLSKNSRDVAHISWELSIIFKCFVKGPRKQGTAALQQQWLGLINVSDESQSETLSIMKTVSSWQRQPILQFRVLRTDIIAFWWYQAWLSFCQAVLISDKKCTHTHTQGRKLLLCHRTEKAAAATESCTSLLLSFLGRE